MQLKLCGLMGRLLPHPRRRSPDPPRLLGRRQRYRRLAHPTESPGRDDWCDRVYLAIVHLLVRLHFGLLFPPLTVLPIDEQHSAAAVTFSPTMSDRSSTSTFE